MGSGSKNPLLRYILIPLASYAENFKVLGPKLWEEFPYLCQKGPVKYKSIDYVSLPRSLVLVQVVGVGVPPPLGLLVGAPLARELGVEPSVQPGLPSVPSGTRPTIEHSH